MYHCAFVFCIFLTFFFLISVKMQPLVQKKLDFEEFCAAGVSVYQLEALEEWEQIATSAFEHFEQEGNRVISVQELAGVWS